MLSAFVADCCLLPCLLVLRLLLFVALPCRCCMMLSVSFLVVVDLLFVVGGCAAVCCCVLFVLRFVIAGVAGVVVGSYCLSVCWLLRIVSGKCRR